MENEWKYGPEFISLLGDVDEISDRPQTPFSQESMEFLAEVSACIRSSCQNEDDEFLRAFGFWCRRKHLDMMKEEYGCRENVYRLGLGTVFHIAASNIPGLFLWSLAIGLLAGNSNIVRISGKRLEEGKKACALLESVLKEKKYENIRKRIAIVAYSSNKKEITEYFSSLCDGRVLWGGDDTIREVQKCTISPLAEELTFPDRFSAALIRAGAVLEASEEELKRQAVNFYKDTYGMDQNACSSPSIVLWYEEKEGEKEAAGRRWWKAILEETRRYALTENQAFEKYRFLCNLAVQREEWSEARRYGNLLYVVPLKEIKKDTWAIRGNSGVFLEYGIKELDELEKIGNRRLQTLCFWGFEKKEIQELILRLSIKGIDRVVPFGQSMEMGLTWDGKNLIHRLSREIV